MASKLTHTNLFALSEAFPVGTTSIGNRVPSTDAPHLSRCMKAGLLRVDASDVTRLVLTADGVAAVALYRETRDASKYVNDKAHLYYAARDVLSDFIADHAWQVRPRFSMGKVRA